MTTLGSVARYAAMCLCAVLVVKIQAICEETPVLIWRNSNITCPPRVVCAELFSTRRDLSNGEQCDEQRITHNCLCPGNSVCPFTEQAHALYASNEQVQFTCQPVCKLPFCDNIRTQPVVAQTVEQNAKNFGGKTYTRVNCRCSGNHLQNRLSSGNTLQSAGRRLNINSNTYSLEYKCSGTISTASSDPCED